MSKRNNYDVLDKILSEAGHPARTNDKRWVAPDPDHPEDGYEIDSQESLDDLMKSVEELEKYLRS